MILHWDSKKITYSNKKEKDERLAILGSFPGLNDDDGIKRFDQFFGAPLIARGTGFVHRCAHRFAHRHLLTRYLSGIFLDRQ